MSWSGAYPFFARPNHRGGQPESLMVVYNDGARVIVKNEEGNVMLDCSRWLFEQCWKRGWFE